MRTDRTAACVSCALRVVRGMRCPICGANDLADLRTSHGQRKARKALRDVPTIPSWRVRAAAFVNRLYWPVGFVCVWGLAATRMAGDNKGLGETCLAAAIIGVFVWMLLYGLVVAITTIVHAGSWVTRRAALVLSGKSTSWLAPEPRRLRSLEIAPSAEIDSSTPRERFRGRVRVSTPLRSPLSNQLCAAYRIVGQSAVGPVDDGAVTPFEIDCGDHRVLVEGAAASIQIDVPSPREEVSPGQPLRQFLSARGLLLFKSRLELAEAVILAGDEVEVEGIGQMESRPSGYRGSRLERVFVDRPGQPLIIRKPCNS